MINPSEPNVSRETIDDLKSFSSLVKKWTASINLIAPATVDDLWTRHVLDSTQIYPLAPHGFKHWVDIGSGGGFPGIVVAILAKAQNPSAKFTLIESDQRKSTFLRTASRTLGLNVTVLSERIEVSAPQNCDVISARALSPLIDLFSYVDRHLIKGGTAIIPKGRKYAQEIEAAKRNWSFDLDDVASKTDADARILIIRSLKRE